jgi:hypothetical protein
MLPGSSSGADADARAAIARRARVVLGLVFLLIVVASWIGASFITQVCDCADIAASKRPCRWTAKLLRLPLL